MLQKYNHPLMVYVIKEAFNISVHNVIYLVCHDVFIYSLNCVVTTLIWAESKRKLLELWLIYRLKDFLEDTLNHFVLE